MYELWVVLGVFVVGYAGFWIMREAGLRAAGWVLAHDKTYDDIDPEPIIVDTSDGVSLAGAGAMIGRYRDLRRAHKLPVPLLWLYRLGALLTYGGVAVLIVLIALYGE